ncbi:MAG: hypothetical protein ACLR23_22170 [Clostridia bacterium]
MIPGICPTLLRGNHCRQIKGIPVGDVAPEITYEKYDQGFPDGNRRPNERAVASQEKLSKFCKSRSSDFENIGQNFLIDLRVLDKITASAQNWAGGCAWRLGGHWTSPRLWRRGGEGDYPSRSVQQSRF